ncbi:MAG TPA: hypothetical protein VGO35_05275 [Gammaproteobacteria bacterium]|jgi:hypothetical protein|nr:hypothetical protein [Gammaproteobacteria bacterium]
MMHDIFTLDELKTPNLEHLIPAALGGRKSSKKLINKITNNQLGSAIDAQITDAFIMVINGLGIESRRGKKAGYAIKPKDGSKYNLGSGFKPELRKPGFRDEIQNEKRTLSIEARTPDEAKRLLEAARVKYKGMLDEKTLSIQEKQEFIKDAFPISLSLGGALQLRAVGKILFEMSALALGNEIACSSAFDQIRNWILEGVTYRDEFVSGARKDLNPMANHDYRVSVWEGLPVLEKAPFQHRVFVFGGKSLGGAWGCIEFFGHIRFSSLLSTDSSLIDYSYCYLVDSLSDNKLERSDLITAVTTRHVMQHAVSLSDGRKALGNLMNEMYKKHMSDLHSQMIDSAMRDCMPKSGEIITQEHVDKFSRHLAGDFVKHRFQINTEKTLTTADLEAMIKKQDKDKS